MVLFLTQGALPSYYYVHIYPHSRWCSCWYPLISSPSSLPITCGIDSPLSSFLLGGLWGYIGSTQGYNCLCTQKSLWQAWKIIWDTRGAAWVGPRLAVCKINALGCAITQIDAGFSACPLPKGFIQRRWWSTLPFYSNYSPIRLENQLAFFCKITSFCFCSQVHFQGLSPQSSFFQ